MSLRDEIQRLLAPIRRRIFSMVSKAVLLEYRHSGALPLLSIQLGKDEVRDNVEMVQPYGFASHPAVEAEVVPVFIGGMREHGVAVVVDASGTRIKLNAEGDVALYRETGEKVYLSQGKVRVEAGTVEIHSGEVTLGDGGVLKRLVHEEFASVFNNHGHEYVSPNGTLITATPVTGSPPTLPTPPLNLTSSQLTQKIKGV